MLNLVIIVCYLRGKWEGETDPKLLFILERADEIPILWESACILLVPNQGPTLAYDADAGRVCN